MLPISGQNNFYKFNLHNDLDSSPLVHIKIFTDRAQVAGNYITLGIPDRLFKDSLPRMTEYVNTRLQSLGARLVTGRLSSFADAVREGRAVANEEFPSYIKVSNYIDARRVIDDLFTHNEMSASDRSDMEDALRELEKSARFATLRTETISTAQKEIIQSVVSPYIDDIKSEAPDSLTAKEWVKCAARALETLGPSAVKDRLSSFLATAGLSSGCGKSESFYECLFAISKIYASMGDLEGTLEQLGESLPSNSIIQQTILDLFD